MNLHRSRSLARVLVVAGLVIPGVAAAQAAGFADIAGTWLVAPDDYDAWAERGIEIAAYPVLRIGRDGRFTLYRLRGLCVPDGPDGKQLEIGSLERDLACAAARERSAKDGLRAAYARVSAAGQVKREGKAALRFASEEQSAMPSEWAQLLPQLRAQGAFRDEATAKRHEAFHSTYYVLNGRPAAYERKGASLILADPEARRELEYRLVRFEVLDSAMAMSLVFGFSSGDHFRCLVAKLDAAIPPTGAPTPLGKVALLAREVSPRRAALMLLDGLVQAGRATAQQRTALEQAIERVRKDESELYALPLAKAIAQDGPAKALGCPKARRL
jgi:hypothetical protein